MSLKSLVTTVTELFIEWSHAVIKKGKISQMPIPRAIEASFAQSAESAILDYVISNVNISGSIHPTVLEFGEHIPVCVFYKPNKFHVNRIAHSQSSKRGCASCPCIFDPLCSVTSDRHILASRGPISLTGSPQ